MPVSVAGVFFRDGRLLLGKRRPGGSIGERWEFPGGKVEPGETPQQALEREFLEELGVLPQVGKLLAVGEFDHKGTLRRLEAYLVQLPPQGAFHLYEHDRTAMVPCAEAAGYQLADSDRAILEQVRAALDC